MAKITLKGNPVTTSGELPKVGDTVSDFSMTKLDLSDVKLSDYSGKRKILNIFPSVDTPVCATSIRHFNEMAAKAANAVILCISADLPFAQKRFCGAEGIEKVEMGSTFRSQFASEIGIKMMDSGLKGLCARAVIVLDENNNVLHSELVPEIAQEPNYEKALDALK